MTVRELIDELEAYGDHLHVLVEVPGQDADRAYAIDLVSDDGACVILTLEGKAVR